jgi:hypothetical protein
MKKGANHVGVTKMGQQNNTGSSIYFAYYTVDMDLKMSYVY